MNKYVFVYYDRDEYYRKVNYIPFESNDLFVIEYAIEKLLDSDKSYCKIFNRTIKTRDLKDCQILTLDEWHKINKRTWQNEN